jgi:Na+/glutamate symporter
LTFFIAALAKAYPKPHNLEKTHFVICSGFVLICILWNIFCFVLVAPSMFPNFWFERGLVLTADCMGHSYTGLLFARTLDPALESPVPAAYAYKLMLFFIPSRQVYYY